MVDRTRQGKIKPGIVGTCKNQLVQTEINRYIYILMLVDVPTSLSLNMAPARRLGRCRYTYLAPASLNSPRIIHLRYHPDGSIHLILQTSKRLEEFMNYIFFTVLEEYPLSQSMTLVIKSRGNFMATVLRSELRVGCPWVQTSVGTNLHRGQSVYEARFRQFNENTAWQGGTGYFVFVV